MIFMPGNGSDHQPCNVAARQRLVGAAFKAKRLPSLSAVRLQFECKAFVILLDPVSNHVIAVQAVPSAEKLTKGQLQPGAERLATQVEGGAERVVQEVLLPEAQKLADQASSEYRRTLYAPKFTRRPLHHLRIMHRLAAVTLAACLCEGRSLLTPQR